jgi:uncharacterized protein
MVRLIPKDNSFFQMFTAMSDNVIVGARLLVDLFADYTDVEKKIDEVHHVESQGDELTHAILTKLNQTFITPFDREDMHELCGTMDDVIDLIDAAASRFVLYRVDSLRSGTLELAKVLAATTIELKAAIHAMESPDKALQHVIEVNRFENESDRICRTLIAQLFEEEKNPVQIIKWKEIFEVMETAVDKCEDVSNVIESVILKNA